jgi:hypothetical protein
MIESFDKNVYLVTHVPDVELNTSGKYVELYIPLAKFEGGSPFLNFITMLKSSVIFFAKPKK